MVDGRAYIECSDNGIGMGERELREVFSHAGMRFADLPEYLEEETAWKAKGIHLHPNSRFGIGVLSYFMIADDITVTTCRLDRDGHPGNRLQVDIAGPGSLFYIRDLGRSHDSGTTVRLYLRAPDTAPSCTDLLRRLLWISDYSVTATDQETSISWSPRQLSAMAPLGSEDPHGVVGRNKESVRVDATSTPDVWWCSTRGGVLSDGVWAGIPLFGAVVNLTGRHTPQLTVDRRQSLHHDEAYVSRLLQQEVPALLREDARVLTHGWLSELVGHAPSLADEVAARAVDARHTPWRIRGHDVDVTAVGCFAQDSVLIRTKRPIPSVTANLPEHIADWRLLAWAKAVAFPGVSVLDPAAVPVARPTDVVLLRRLAERDVGGASADFMDFDLNAPYGGGHSWLSREGLTTVGHVLNVAEQLGFSPAQVVTRLAELGHQLPETAMVPEYVRSGDALMLSRDLDGAAPWLTVGEAVHLGHVLRAASRLGCRPVEVVGRLAELGHYLPDGVPLPDSVREEDTVLLSHSDGFVQPGIALTGQAVGPWLEDREVVELGHVLRAARATQRSPGWVAGRLAELGHHLPDGVSLPDSVRNHDLVLLSRGLDGRAPWLVVDECVNPGHVLTAADRMKRSPADVAGRLMELGYRLSEEIVFGEVAGRWDTLLLSRDLDSRTPWLESAAPVELGHVLKGALISDRSPAQVAGRLAELGHYLPEGVVVPETAQLDDIRLLSRGFDSAAPWLAIGESVEAGHVLRGAARTESSPMAVALRLAEFGHHLPEGVVVPDSAQSDDTLMLSCDLDRDAPWLGLERPLSLGHVLSVATVTGRTPADIAGRLAMFGLHLPENTPAPDSVARDDQVLLSTGADGTGPWLDAGDRVSLGHILTAADATRKSPVEVAARLAELGYLPPAGVAFDLPGPR